MRSLCRDRQLVLCLMRLDEAAVFSKVHGDIDRQSYINFWLHIHNIVIFWLIQSTRELWLRNCKHTNKRNTNPVTIKSKSDRLLSDTRQQWYFIDLIWLESANRYCCTATFTKWYYIMVDRCVLILPLVFYLKCLIFITLKFAFQSCIFYIMGTSLSHVKHLFKINVCPLQQNAV